MTNAKYLPTISSSPTILPNPIPLTQKSQGDFWVHGNSSLLLGLRKAVAMLLAIRYTIQLSAVLGPPLVALALSFDFDLKEKRLMSRREKLPDFLRTMVPEAEEAETLARLERSSWDWLKVGSFFRCLVRNSSLVPLRRKPTRRA